MEKIEHTNGTCGCECSMCHVGHHRGFRLVVLVLIIILSFWLGSKLGEIRGYMGGSYGYGMHYRGVSPMMYGYGYNDEWGTPGNMMYYNNSAVPPKTTTTPTPSTTPATPAKQ